VTLEQGDPRRGRRDRPAGAGEGAQVVEEVEIGLETSDVRVDEFALVWIPTADRSGRRVATRAQARDRP
jgi:hypothetical protein